jgi:hypothetical protein
MKSFISLISLLLLLICQQLFAQSGTAKLKDVQTTNVWAPANIKIDGALSEWNDTFQAYNKSTRLYYTVANDDKNIYLAIKSTDAMTSNKITAGGITVTINTQDKKKDEGAYALTFPVIQRPSFTQRPQGSPGGFGGGAAGIVNIRVGGNFGPGPGNAGTGADSAMRKAAHDRLIAASKEIKISGFKDITDSLVSIYNEYGIKAAIGYNTAGNFLYELAVPLKQLGLSIGDTKEIAYNVKLNGLQIVMRMNDVGGGGVRDVAVVGGGPGGGGGGFAGPQGGNTSFQEMTSPSDFWGKYTLANKQ